MARHDTPPPELRGRDDWIGAARQGSPAALGRLLESYRRYLLLIANDELAGLMRQKIAASDVVQETFLEAQQDFRTFRGETRAELAQWLRQILLHNLANQRRRFERTDMRQVRRETSLEAPGPDGRPGLDVPARYPSPSRCASDHEEAEALERAMQRLAPDYREVLLWRHRDNLSFSEIGERQGRSADAARKLWARAVLALREQMGPAT